MVALFVPGSGTHRRTMLLADRAGQPWARLSPTWIPTVALLWPADLARRFVGWVAERGYDPWGRDRGDDGFVGKFCAMNRIPVFAPVPSIVEHPDVEPSLIGRRAMGGKNRARVAAIFGGE